MASTNNLSTDISVLIQEFYERKALKERLFDNGILKYAERLTVDKNNSDVAHYHKWQKFAIAGDVAQNADPATGISANAVEVKAQMVEFASFINIPNWGDVIRIDSLVKESYKKFIEQAERTANFRVTTALAAGSAGSSVAGGSFSALPVIYAGGRSSFAELQAGDVLTNKDVTRAVARLEQQGAPKIGGSYLCGLNPWTKNDLMIADADFRGLIKLGNLDILKKNDLPMWANARIINQDEPFRETLGGTENTYVAGGNVISTYVFGAQCFGITQVMGLTGIKPRFKVQDITTTGAVTTIGYRIPFAGIVLDTTFGVVIKSVTTDASIANNA